MAKNRGQTGAYTIRVDNLGPVVRGYRRVSTEMGKAVRDALKAAAEPVAVIARGIAAGKGLVDKGKLVSGIRVWATATEVGIVERAVRKGGFSYPRVYEYGARGGDESVGPRAFMEPAAERGSPIVERTVLDAVADVADRNPTA